MDAQKKAGEKIRLYRKLKGLTLEELASQIHKSKSILSKYELGDSVFDMDTLYQIAEALDIDPAQLLEPRKKAHAPTGKRYGIFENSALYVYMLVKDKSYRLLNGYLMFGGSCGNMASFYFQVPDFEHYTDCKVLYTGQLYCYSGNAFIHFINQADETDHVSLSVAVRMGNLNTCLGLMMMSGYATNDPGAVKVLLSKAPISDESELTRCLTIDRDDIGATRRSNIFTYRLSTMDQDLFRK